jgi:hypothetical protein
MEKHFSLYDTVPNLDDCPESLDNLPDNHQKPLDNHPTIPCPPLEEEERMPLDWQKRYHDTHYWDD